MANNTIDISQLKSGNVDAPAKNIDGHEQRDFGNGMKEFDPAANGFKKEEKQLKPNDKDRALMEFDKQMESRREEVEQFNELIDQYGGQISEEELREELNQQHITEILHDGSGDKFEDNNTKVVEMAAPAKENVPVQQSSELDELERELDDDMAYEHIAVPAHKPETVEVAKPTTAAQTIQEELKPEPPKYIPVPDKTKEKNIPELSDEDKDLAALEGDVEAPTEDFDAKLKAELSKKMKPVTKKFDLSAVAVSNKPITVSNATNKVVRMDKKIFTWALPRSKRPVSVKAFTATELNVLQSYVENRSRSRDVFKTIWDHIIGNKGDSFDTWAKCTSYFDVDHLWFAIYGACFNGANYLPYTCPKCNEVTVANDIPLETMCKSDKPGAKEEIEKLRHIADDPDFGNVFAGYRVQVSDQFVFEFKEPSIYDTVIVPTMFDAEFSRKYSDIIGVCAYISNIYCIDMEGDSPVLRPIAVKEFINNETKTQKAKVIQYAKIIRTLESDQYSVIMGHVNAMNESDSVYYCLPAVSCDHCKQEIEEERSAAADLVFMRHRLAILGV
nr:MAG TPA: hypothetical protein [Caudoviricetes sp.]